MTVVLATLLLYLASFAAYLWNLFAPRLAIGRAASVCLTAGLGLHYYALLERAHLIQAVPYEDLWGSLSLFAWLLAATYLSLEVVHRRRSVGPFVLPIVILLFALSHLRAAIPHPAPARGPLFALHVTLNILAYAAFTLAFILSAIFVLQNQMLRRHKQGAAFWRLPSLDLLEWMSRSAVVVGVAALCTGVVFGFVWAHRLEGHYWNGDPKEIVTLLLLALYAAYLWLSRRPAWRGARASALCMANFLLVIFSYSIVNVYLSRYHRFY
jgi:ABC-type transport system involved in cytochrome c biogenesis permease subunit